MSAALLIAWQAARAAFTHRWVRLAAAGAALFAAGWVLRPRPVAVTRTDTTTAARTAEYSMGRVGLRIKGGTTVLTLGPAGEILTVSNTGGELLMVQRTSSTRTSDTETHQREDARIPAAPTPGKISSSTQWGLGGGGGIGLDGTRRFGAIGTYHLFGPFDLAAVSSIPASFDLRRAEVLGFALVRW